MPFIYFGTDLAIKECQNQFKNRHWNCTLFDKNRLIGNVLDSGWNFKIPKKRKLSLFSFK